MRVELLRVTEKGVDLVAGAASLCGELPCSNNKEIVEMMAANDYSSVLEHVYFTFEISNISIALSRELLEHRIASHTSRSTRYQEEHEFEYYLPEPGKDIVSRENAITEILDAMEDARRHYRALRARGVSREVARYVLPMAAYTQLVVTMNCRSLINFFSLRLCVRAAPEMRALAEKMYEYCNAEYPEIFENIWCRGITHGVCPENEARPNSCPFKVGIKTKKQLRKEIEDDPRCWNFTKEWVSHFSDPFFKEFVEPQLEKEEKK